MRIYKMMAMAVVAVVLAGALQVVMAEDAAAAPEAGKAIKAQTTCPVLEGNPINKKIYMDYEGKRIYFCCGGCIKTVKKDPAKYVKMIEDQGITLDKVPAPAPAK